MPAAATGCEDVIPRPYGVVERRGPGALCKQWAQERGPHFGRDQIDNFSGILAEIRSTNSPTFWPRSVRDFLLLRVGDPALLLQAAGRAMRAYVFYISYPPLHLSFVCSLCVQTPALRCKNERVNAVREELESQPESYVRDVTDGMQ